MSYTVVHKIEGKRVRQRFAFGTLVGLFKALRNYDVVSIKEDE